MNNKLEPLSPRYEAALDAYQAWADEKLKAVTALRGAEDSSLRVVANPVLFAELLVETTGTDKCLALKQIMEQYASLLSFSEYKLFTETIQFAEKALSRKYVKILIIGI